MSPAEILQKNPTISSLLAEIELPEKLTEITDEKPAFYQPSIQDGYFAYYLASEDMDVSELADELGACIRAAGYELEYSERMEFFYQRGEINLRVSIDTSPEGASKSSDGQFAERTWKTIGAGRIVVTFNLPPPTPPRFPLSRE